MVLNFSLSRAVGKLIRSRSEKIYIATKCGRFINPHINAGYQPKILGEFVVQSLKNTGLDRIDLIQLHCPPTQVYYRPEIFEEFEKLKKEGKIAHLGVSVERVEEGLKAIEYSNVETIEIIFNMFRHRPAELFFKEAKKRNIGIIARVPLASGLLTGKFKEATNFSIMFEKVSCAIPGVSRIDQLDSNLKALEIRNLSTEEIQSVKEVYNELIRKEVHHRW